MAHGRYIALEGAEGCGKSTQAERLALRLGAVLTRETGGTPIGRRIREILHDITVTDLAARAEALLTAADRAQHITQIVRPALAAGRHVISDRSVYSTLAYQGFGRGLALDDVRRINDWAIDGCWPEVVVLIDVDSSLLAERMAGRELDRFEQETDDFHDRVRAGFRTLAELEPDRWIVVDGSGPADEVTARIARAVHDRIGV
jgi:dTMP kinase